MGFRRFKHLRRSAAALAGLLLLQLGWLALAAAAAGSADLPFAAGAFRKVWERPDLPVATQAAARSFTWGPEGWAFRQEPYAESPGGNRLVQYFDKTRMEITRPADDPNSTAYVTNGLLVTEMVSGRLQAGDNKFIDKIPSEVPVAGDMSSNPGPTYRSFKGVASLNLDNKYPRTSGDIVKTTIDRDGQVGQSDELGNLYQVKYVEYNPELQHNIPDVFWNFMTQKGKIYQDGQYLDNEPVIDWVSTMGFPLTEAYWLKVVVAGQTRDVLIQLYQRRVLTYTPANPRAFQVEMGNVGAHYYNWRYPGEKREAPWASVTFSNQTPCNLMNVVLTGQDNLSFQVASSSAKTQRLGPGTYTYTVTGCDYDPFVKTRTFEPDEQATIRFGARA